MADNTPTVDEARQALYKAYDFAVGYVRGDSSHPLTHPDNAIDTLIAAVRAEHVEQAIAIANGTASPTDKAQAIRNLFAG